MIKKYTLLGILFVLPVLIYLFFASGVYHFKKLPVMSENIKDIVDFKPLDTIVPISFNDNITVLGFLGQTPQNKQVALLNLNEKIYKRFYKFQNLQFVMVAPSGTEEKVIALKNKLKEVTFTDMSKWKFIFSSSEKINEVFESMHTTDTLKNLGIDNVFIVDKKRNLRGRDDEKRYSYNIVSVAEITNILTDDVKILLTEYGLALKQK